MDDCIFCKIVKGEIPSYKIYEDDKVFVFLDIKPLSKGHTLVLPKGHYESILDTPEDLYAYMARIVKRVSDNVYKKYNPSGILINQNNGEMAGQEVFHAHIHIKPIYPDTPTFTEINLRKVFSKEEMENFVKELSFN